jgi:hypothetical protein
MKEDKGSPNGCNTKAGGRGEGETYEACQDILDWFRSRREEREVLCRRKDERAPVSHTDELNAVDSNAVDGSSKNAKVGCGDEENEVPRMVYMDNSDGATQVTDADFPIPTSQSSHAKKEESKQTKPENPFPIQLPDDENIPIPMAMHLKNSITMTDDKMKTYSRVSKLPKVTLIQIANEEDPPVPAQFMQADAVINKDAAFGNPPGCFDTPTILDDASPVPPSANIHEADKVLPSRRVYD